MTNLMSLTETRVIEAARIDAKLMSSPTGNASAWSALDLNEDDADDFFASYMNALLVERERLAMGLAC